MRKTKKLTPNQEAWKKEVRRIKTAVKRAEKQGFELYNPDEFYAMLEMPKRVTESRLKELHRSTWREKIYNHMIVVDYETGEFWTGREERKRRREKQSNERRARKELERQRKVGEQKRRELEEQKKREREEKEREIEEAKKKALDDLGKAGGGTPIDRVITGDVSAGYLSFLNFWDEFYTQVTDVGSIYDDIYRNPVAQALSEQYTEQITDLLMKEIHNLQNAGFTEEQSQCIIGERLSGSTYAMGHLNTVMYDSDASQIQTSYQVLYSVILARNLTFEETIQIDDMEQEADGI